MSGKGKLFFLCGKMGAGKSTLAEKVVFDSRALLISEDEWLAAHFPSQIQSFDDYIRLSNRIKPFIKSHVQRLVEVGTTTVMDFPANTIKQRQWFLELCSEVGCDHELLYLDVSDKQCLCQLEKRRLQQPERAHFDTPAMFHQVTQYFEPPSCSEGLNIVVIQ